jgi:hypothetical protein
MENHTALERKLRADLMQKNVMRKSLEKKLSRIDAWNQILEKTHNPRKKAKLSGSISRYQEETENLKKELFVINEDLEKRIKAEMKFSEDEIKNFQKQLEQDQAELNKVKAKIEDVKKDETKAKTKTDLSLVEKRIRLEKLLKADTKKVQEDIKELDSEARDKALFTLELKRISVDKTLFNPGA